MLSRVNQKSPSLTINSARAGQQPAVANASGESSCYRITSLKLDGADGSRGHDTGDVAVRNAVVLHSEQHSISPDSHPYTHFSRLCTYYIHRR
ncbi:hypothetical protein M378DRAFT_168952 [Amanita muscaria Koide BX008]|uniref:Uncharacterized protein n=1 Tax=Amanita muscaria (strain Koide BX008) TaxID=946122 RepID=A0A0C2WTM8_AMAMK|nr:hypothetical protein M378DRAFT_168952 [Amanita muscaria Koide BX008]